MATVEERIANRDKRPRYQVGDRLRVTLPGWDGWCGGVREVTALQKAIGIVETYLYRLQMDNLAVMTWQEEHLTLEDTAASGGPA